MHWLTQILLKYVALNDIMVIIGNSKLKMEMLPVKNYKKKDM